MRGKEDLDTVAGNHLGGGSGEVLGGKTVIIADNQPLAVESFLLQVIGYPLGTETHVFKGEVLGDNRPPAIGAKFYRVLYLPHPLGPSSPLKEKGRNRM